MDFRKLEYFVATAETGSFSKAARRCRVAQPSLSQQIAKLEAQLGRRLFDRLGRTIALTDAGAALLSRARSILRDVRRLESEVTEDVEAGRGRLTIGALPTIAPFMLPGLVQRFKKRCPEAEISIRESFTDTLVAAVVDAEVDVALTSLPIDDPRIEVELLFEEPLLLVVPPGFRLARGKTVTMGALRDVPAIVLDEMHCLGEQIDSFCRARRVLDRVVCQTAQLATALSLVELGIGVSLVPEMCAKADRGGKRTYHGLGARGPKRAIAAITRRERSRRRLVEEFLVLARASS